VLLTTCIGRSINDIALTKKEKKDVPALSKVTGQYSAKPILCNPDPLSYCSPD